MAAPPTQRQPVLLFACVHDLLLGAPDDELARFYPNLTATPEAGDPVPAFRRFCASRPRAARRAADVTQHADERDRALRPARAGTRDDRR